MNRIGTHFDKAEEEKRTTLEDEKMTAFRWNMFEGPATMSREMQRGFGRMAREADEGCSGEWIPAVDIAESDEAYVLYVELPGMKREDIKISIQNNMLAISGEKKRQVEENIRFVRSERNFGTFCRTFSLPHGIDNNRTEAIISDGVLKVVLNKAEEQKPHEIKIN